jgi:hypothetical protein
MVTVAGLTWDLWVGYNGSMRVYSFVVPSGTVNNFSADVKEFFNYLQNNYQYPASTQNLIGKLLSLSMVMLNRLVNQCTQFSKLAVRRLPEDQQLSLCLSSLPILTKGCYILWISCRC